MKITGAKAHVFFDSFDEAEIIEGGGNKTTEANKWYFIYERGENSSLPYKGSVFRAPKSEAGIDQIALVEGDKVYPLDEERICKTSASLSVEEGVVDVSDDCDPGSNILDGLVSISGSIAGFFRFNDQNQDFDDVTGNIINRFFDTVEDDGAGIYEEHPRNNGLAYFLINLNSNAKIGQIEHWLFIPVIISSMSMSLGNTDVQNKDLSWSKGEGRAIHYKVPKAA